jgi:hypothetical protein
MAGNRKYFKESGMGGPFKDINDKMCKNAAMVEKWRRRIHGASFHHRFLIKNTYIRRGIIYFDIVFIFRPAVLR